MLTGILNYFMLTEKINVLYWLEYRNILCWLRKEMSYTTTKYFMLTDIFPCTLTFHIYGILLSNVKPGPEKSAPSPAPLTTKIAALFNQILSSTPKLYKKFFVASKLLILWAFSKKLLIWSNINLLSFLSRTNVAVAEFLLKFGVKKLWIVDLLSDIHK